MKKRLISMVMVVAVAFSFIACGTVYKKATNVTCKDAQINGAFYKVRCVGEMDASPEKIEATFAEHATNVCKENGYSGFKIGDNIPQTPSGYNATIECTP